MEVEFLGGADEVGRSAVLVDDRLLLDYGMAASNPPRYPVGDVDPEAVVVSHGHLDHAGAVPALLAGDARPPVHWTPPTRDLALLLARDTLSLHGGTPQCPFTETDVARLTQVSTPHGYGESFEAAGYEVTLFDAGHIPGSAHVLVTDREGRRPAERSRGQRPQDGETRLLYAGDYHTDEHRGSGAPASRPNRPDESIRGQRLVAGSTDRPPADVVITEGTYAGREHEPRPDVERRFVELLRTTVWEGGTTVVPAFAIGRTQEVMLICDAYGIDCYVDGMGTRVTDLLRGHPDYVRDPEALRRAASNARVVDGRSGQRERIAAGNNVIVTTSGMLGGGPAMTYVPEIHDDPVNAIALTGYQVEGTPGRELLDTGSAEFNGRVLPVSARVEQFDFSAHADRGGLREFLSSYRDSEVLVVHGDDTAGFAADLRADGFDAAAPGLGDRVEVG